MATTRLAVQRKRADRPLRKAVRKGRAVHTHPWRLIVCRGAWGDEAKGGGMAAQVLTDLGADLNGAPEQVIRILDEHRRETG